MGSKAPHRAWHERLISPRSRVAQYGITFGGVIATAFVVALTNSGLGVFRYLMVENPGTVFMIPVVGAAVAFGLGPALFAVMLSLAFTGAFFRAQETPQRLVVLLLSMLVIVLLAERQRRAWEHAERVKARLGAILESMSDAVLFVDATGHPEDLNTAAHTLLRSPDREAALSPPPGVPGDLPAAEYALLARALAGEMRAHAEMTMTHDDGLPRTMSMVATPVRDHAGQIIGAVSVSRDVTDFLGATAERERLLMRVAEQAAQLQASVAATVDAIAIYDANGNTLLRNAANHRLFGLTADRDWDRFDIVKQVNMRHPDGRPLTYDELHTTRALRGDTVNGEVLLITDLTGRDRYVRQNAAPIRSADGTVLGAVLVTNDITEERARTDEREQLLSLVEERRKFAQTVFDSVPVGLAVLDAHTLQYQAVNPAYLATVPEPYRQHSLFGLTLPEVFGGAPQPTLISRLEVVVETGVAHTERAVRIAHPQRGETYWDEMLVPLSTDLASPRFVLLQQVDVTEQVLARHRIALLASAAADRAAELEAIISSVPDGIAIGSASGQIRQFNAAARKILGVEDPEEGDFQHLAHALAVRRFDGSPATLEELPSVRAARGETFSGQELLLTTPRGEVFVSASGAPIRGAGDEITGIVVLWSDITERKRAAGLMTRLGHIVDSSSNEVFVLDAQSFRVIQANEGARRNLGYDQTVITTRTLLDLAPGLDKDTFEMLVAPLWTNAETQVVYEVQFIRANGTGYPVEMQVYLSRSEMPPVYVAIAQDITERHTALRQREALFREIDERRRFAQTVIETAPTGIAVFSADDAFTVRIANEQYCQLFDEPWRTHGVVGEPVHVFLPDAEASGILPIYRKVLTTGSPVFLREFEYHGTAHGTMYLDWSLVPLREDGSHITGLLLLTSDVTERVRTRQRIEELAWDAAQRANELETTLASITDGVIVTDATRTIKLENAAAKRLFGAAHVATIVEAGGTPPETQSLFADTMPLARAMRGETVEDQVLLVREPGTDIDRYLLCSSAPVQATDAMITGAVAVFRDITAIKQVEQLKDEFISVAAHELRTPLTAIKGYAELLERRLGRDADRERERQSLAVIRKQAERLARLVNEMLDVSRIEAGRLQLDRERFDLSALVAETMENLRTSSERHTFIFDATPDIEIVADASRIEQVLINLISNAITYSPNGGTVTARVRAGRDDVTIAVSDEGIGIAADEIPQLFSRFYRSPRSGVLRGGGMGLGLYISHEIIERHGGTIHVESQPGVGSTFIVSLPRV